MSDFLEFINSNFFQCGSFVVAKLDAPEKRPPAIWKIEYKGLLQKYVPCEGNDEQMLYQSTNSVNVSLSHLTK